jgi:hypothetical protein
LSTQSTHVATSILASFRWNTSARSSADWPGRSLQRRVDFSAYWPILTLDAAGLNGMSSPARIGCHGAAGLIYEQHANMSESPAPFTDLPQIRDAFDAGRISYSKVRAIARVATPVSEADLLDAALHAPAAQVEQLTREMLTAQRNSPTPDDVGLKPRRTGSPKKRIRWNWDPNNGDLVISGRLAPEDGARLLAAATRASIERTRSKAKSEEVSAQDAPPAATMSSGSPDVAASSNDHSETGGSDERASLMRKNKGSERTEPISPTTDRAQVPMSELPLSPVPTPDGSAEPSERCGFAESASRQQTDEAADCTAEGQSGVESSDSPDDPALTTRPPSDLGPALVAMAEMVCSNLAAPWLAPTADVLVTVDIQTLAEAFAETVEHEDAANAPRSPSATSQASDADRSDAKESPSSGPHSTPEPMTKPDDEAASTSTPVPAPQSQPEPESEPAPDTAPTADRLKHAACSAGHHQEARLDDGPALVAASLRRLADDGRLRFAINAADGRTVDIGRARRIPSTGQLRALWRRDHGCAVPGCGRIKFLHAHHVVFWTNGGRTTLDNLVLLCEEHHRALHDGAFTIIALGSQRFRFNGPDGATYSPAPPISGLADDLTAEHPGIEPNTIEPDWDGQPIASDAAATYLSTWHEVINRNKSADHGKAS